MNEKITLPSLVNLLAERSGKSKKQCEDFIKEFFNTIANALADGDSVRVKGLGTFKVQTVMERKSIDVNTGQEIEIPRHSKISFIPAKELADEVNAPFEMFESVEIPEDSDEIQATIVEEDPTDKTAPQQEVNIESNIAGDPASDIISNEEDAKVKGVSEDYAVEDNNAEEDDVIVDIEENNADEDVVIVDDVVEEDTADNDFFEETDVPKKRNYRFLLGFAAGLAFAAILALCAYLFIPVEWYGKSGLTSQNSNKELAESPSKVSPESAHARGIGQATTEESTDSVVNDQNNKVVAAEKGNGLTEDLAPTQPSDQPVYDTISKTRYLTTMAKEHYGNYNLWPFIYEENKSILGHPDRIRPGTRVVIPSLSKYGVSASNPEDIRKAKSMGVAIYARYQ